MESGFSPIIWPEEKAPPEAVNCTKCELQCQRSRVIWGEGNPEAPVFVILDNPGAREDKEGNLFVCGTRQTLQQAVYDTGLKQEDLYITYVLKCRPLRKYNKEVARGTCMDHLLQQIKLRRPQLAMCLGNVAVQSLLGREDAEVKSLRGEWHNVRGLPVCVSYHPLAVRRRPNLYRSFLQDWEMLAQRLCSLKEEIY